MRCWELNFKLTHSFSWILTHSFVKFCLVCPFSHISSFSDIITSQVIHKINNFIKIISSICIMAWNIMKWIYSVIVFSIFLYKLSEKNLLITRIIHWIRGIILDIYILSHSRCNQNIFTQLLTIFFFSDLLQTRTLNIMLFYDDGIIPILKSKENVLE